MTVRRMMSLVGYALPLATLIACSSDGAPSSPADAGAAPDVNDVVDAAAGDDAAPEAAAEAAVADAPTDSNDAGACGMTTPVQSAACTQCLVTSCCAETATCLGDSACAALDACTNKCVTSNGGDAGSVGACAQECNTDAPADVRLEWRAYNDCLTFRCVDNGAGPCQ